MKFTYRPHPYWIDQTLCFDVHTSEYRIVIRFVGNSVLLEANRDGLLTLARNLLTLAQPGVPTCSDVHYDNWNMLEQDSINLVIERHDLWPPAHVATADLPKEDDPPVVHNYEFHYSPPPYEEKLQMEFKPGFGVSVNIGFNEVVILGNPEGLETLAMHMITLAQSGVPSGTEATYQPGLELLPGSEVFTLRRTEPV